MHAKVEFSTLRESLSLAARFASKMHGFENVHLEATGENVLRLVAGDGDGFIRMSLDADVGEEGNALTPARFASEFVRTLPAGTVTLSVNGHGVLQVTAGTAGRTRGNLRLVDGYIIELEQPIQLAEFRVPADELSAALDGVLFAADKGDMRPQLSGIYFDFRDDLTLVGTDSYRLALTRLPIHVEAPSVVVPAQSLKRLLPLLQKVQKVKDEVSIALFGDETPSRIVFRIPLFRETVLNLPLVDIPYPKYSSILEAEISTTLTVSPQALMHLVRRARLFALKSSIITLVVNAKQGAVHVLAKSVEHGEYNDFVEADVEGQGLTVAFNGQFLHDALNALRGYPRVRIGLKEPFRPVFIVPEGREYPLHVLMPMRVED